MKNNIMPEWWFAFPQALGKEIYGEISTSDHYSGLTKREYAAIHIMAGFSADPSTVDVDIGSIANAAILWADNLLIELEK